MNYLGHPHKVSKHISTLPFQFNFENGTALVVEGTLDNVISYTTVDDIANVVAGAVDYQGEWPSVGGFHGDSVTIGEMLKIGERVLGKRCRSLPCSADTQTLMHLTGKPFEVEWLKMEDIVAGELKTDKYTRVDIPSIPKEQVEAFSKMAFMGIVIAISRGAWATSDEWNQRLPGLKLTKVEEFLGKLFKA